MAAASSNRPQQGRVVPHESQTGDVSVNSPFTVPGPKEGDYSGDDLRNNQHGSTNDGTWRPNKTFSGEHGLKVMLSRQKGVTESGVLDVPFRLQVPPLGDFERARTRDAQKWTTLRHGERSRRSQGRSLGQYTVSTMLLDPIAQHNADRSVVTWPYAPHPQRMIGELGHILDSETPFRLTVTQAAVWGSATLVNHLVKLVGYKATQRNGEIGTEYLDLTFEEWSSSEVEEGDLPSRPSTRHEEKPKPFKVALGKDDLYEIAKKRLGQASDWRAIATANGMKGVNPASEAELKTWMEKHHRQQLTIPAKHDRVRKTGGGPGALAGGPR